MSHLPSQNQKSVLFVCAANQCRSPMAMAIFRDIILKKTVHPEIWKIESAGVWARDGYSATAFAIQTMRDQGLDLSFHKSQPVTEVLLQKFNLILCMETNQVAFIKKHFPEVEAKVYLISEMLGDKTEIWDPVGYSLDVYQGIADEIRSTLEAGLEKIINLSG